MRRPGRLREQWWQLASVALSVLCAFTAAHAFHLRRALASERERAPRERVAAWLDAWRDIGRPVYWPPMEDVGAAGRSNVAAGPRLVLAVDQDGCYATQEPLVAEAIRAAGSTGAQHMTTVVRSWTRQFAASYARVNRLPGPVFFDPEDRFGTSNGISQRPLLLLLDETGHVLASVRGGQTTVILEAFGQIAQRKLRR